MAGKRKNPADNIYPPRVYRGKSKFEYHPAGGGSISLCPLDSTVPLIWARYEEERTGIINQNTLSVLIADFFKSADFIKLSKETKKDYEKYSKKVIPVFGAMHPDAILPQHIRKYMDKRALKSTVQANREKTFMSRVYGWGYERGMVKRNPAKGVKKFTELARDRYITDEEYAAVYDVGCDVVRVAMEIAYLCVARQGDVLALQEQQLQAEGIFIRQGKTGKTQIKAWAPRLLQAIALARTLPLRPGVTSMHIIHQANGQPFTRDGFNSRWAAAKARAKEKFPGLTFDFTFHDLKAKGISDLKGTLQEKQAISGHKTITQTARYDRKTQIVPVVGGQKKA